MENLNIRLQLKSNCEDLICSILYRTPSIEIIALVGLQMVVAIIEASKVVKSVGRSIT